jgi:hypothetical protein
MPVWVPLVVGMIGFMIFALGVNPYSPVVQHTLAARKRGQGTWIWAVALAASGLGIFVLAGFLR